MSPEDKESSGVHIRINEALDGDLHSLPQQTLSILEKGLMLDVWI